ncbi:transposase, partial [Lacticaseibacillus rhamnosus]
ISDATAVPVKIKYPQDTTLLNQSRLNLEQMVTDLAHGLGVEIPRTYRREAKGKWTAFSRKPRRQNKERRKQLQAQLQYIRRDLRYVAELLAQGGQLTDWQAQRLEVIKQVYEQQLFMFENHTHHVENRIVSLQQPYIRPIVRGKAKQSVEFGAKIDCSMLDGVIDVERFDFNSFNESTDLEVTLDHAFDLVGEYPDEVLVDTLYRTRDNINLCKKL